MDSGAVWSGKIANSLGIFNDITDDYAKIGTLNIGCIGPTADLWVADTPYIDIAGDMFGEIHLLTLEPHQTIRIGGRLGDLSQASVTCSDELPGVSFNTVVPAEESPRGWWEDIEDSRGTDVNHGIAGFGRILIRQPGGLEGHIILDADSDTGTQDPSAWKGEIEVGTGEATDLNLAGAPKIFTLEPAHTDSTRVGPNYTISFNADGGGAIGLVPFQFKRGDADPSSTCTDLPCLVGTGSNHMQVVSAATFDSVGIKLPFYGPIKANVGPGRPIVHMFKGDGMGHIFPSPDYGYNLTYDIAGHNLYLKGDSSIPPGRYIIKHYATDEGLLCDGLLTNADVPVAEFVYHFVLGARSGIGHDARCSDFDGDEDHGTDFDIEAFFACLAGNCCETCGSSDVNCDGDYGTDADIEAFFEILAGADCPEACNP